MGWDWFVFLVYWMISFYFFLKWYEKQMNEGVITKTSKTELFVVFLVSGFWPFVLFGVIIGKVFAVNNDPD